jgi:uncharacterized PurR-regulated membrane protein YhhQ (DUF165 family)
MLWIDGGWVVRTPRDRVETSMQRQETFKPLVVIAVFFASLGAASFVAPKIGVIAGLVFTVGAIPYALTYMCVDIICETRGRLRAYQLVAAGLVAHVSAIGFTLLATAIPPESVWSQPAGVDPTQLSSYPVINRHLLFDELFRVGPQLVAAGLVAYLITQLLNVHFFDYLRRTTRGRMLWLRTLLSTGFCQFIDTIIFVPLAFATLVPSRDLPVIIMGQFAIKLIIAVVVTPIVYLGVGWIRGFRGGAAGSPEGERASAEAQAEGKPAPMAPDGPAPADAPEGAEAVERS